MKKCSNIDCLNKDFQSLDNFNQRQIICKKCQKLRGQKYNESHKEEHRNSQKKWVKSNPEVNKKWRDKNPEKIKGYVLKQNYGISIEEKNRMLLKQDNCCSICNINILEYLEKQKGNKIIHDFCVDHNHETGQLRGLLCGPCNRAIGLLLDNALLLRKAADYLDFHDSLPIEQSNIVPIKKIRG